MYSFVGLFVLPPQLYFYEHFLFCVRGCIKFTLADESVLQQRGHPGLEKGAFEIIIIGMKSILLEQEIWNE